MDTPHGDPDGDIGRPWREAGERWAELRRRLGELGDDKGPDDEDVRRAIETLGAAAKGLVETIGAAVEDPELRARLADATGSLGAAVTESVRILAAELRRPGRAES